MSEIQITLSINRQSGKKDIRIELSSDADYTNYEHDRRHREVVEQLIAKGIMSASEVGDITVEQIRPLPTATKGQEAPGPQESLPQASSEG